MLTLRWLLASVVCALSLVSAASCSGSDSSGNGSASPATQQCNDLLSRYCKKTIGCLVSGGSIPAAQQAQNESACVSSASSAINCDKAVSVGSTYNACLIDIDALDCAEVNAGFAEGGTFFLPSNCYGVIKVTAGYAGGNPLVSVE